VAQSGVERTSLSSSLADRMLKLIRDEGLRPGDRLPSTKDLAQRFAVTTPTLREALRGLEVTGTVELRHGSGVYVGPGLDRVVLPNPNVRRLRDAQLLQLLDARLMIEPPVAELAARNAAPGDLAGMEAILAEAGDRVGRDDELLHTSTMSFHRAVAWTAGNMVLSEVVDSLLTVHASEQREILEIFDDRQRDHEQHCAILDAISRGDVATANERMRSHLHDVREAIARRLAGGPRGNDAEQ
jgi:GntR family transcriptional regulator, transcriptional repressor for pyruvate dehydrogenase complex